MQIIEDLYEAFADVPRPKELRGCSVGCCMPSTDEVKILSQPLRQAAPEILWYYPDDAIWTVGTEMDFKYFLPRLLELGLSDYERDGTKQGFIAFPETFGKKLELAGFATWSDDQRHLVDQAIFEILKKEAERRDFYNVESWLNVMCRITLPKSRYFEFLESEKQSDLRNKILVSFRNEYEGETISGPFWDELRTDQTKEFALWLRSKEAESDIAPRRFRRQRRNARKKGQNR